jgi:hypothetical protein
MKVKGTNELALRSVCLAIVASLMFFVAGQAYATTYYVKNGGDDRKSGLSDAEAWATIGKVDSFQFSPGDTVCLKRGSVFSDRTFVGPRVDSFTLQDYGTGSKPHIDVNIIKAIDINPVTTIRNLTIRNIDISGQNWAVGKDSAIVISGVDGLLLDGIYGDGHRNNLNGGKTAITVGASATRLACKGTIEIKNCELLNYGPPVIPTPGTDFMGLVLYGIVDGIVSIHDNVIHDVNADCIQIYLSTATVDVFNNTLYNPGENCIDIKASSNVTVHDNQVYRQPTFVGYGGSGGGSIIGIHDPTLQYLTTNIVIRNNKFSGEDSNAINLGHCSNVQILDNQIKGGTAMGVNMSDVDSIQIGRNRFEGLSGTIYIGLYTSNLEVFENTISNPKILDRAGFDAGGIYENNNSTNVTKIYNNTIYNSSGLCGQLININTSQGTQITNNVVYQGRATGVAPRALYAPGHGKLPIVENNCWYNAASSGIIRFLTTDYGLTNYAVWRAGHPGDIFADPEFTDPSNGDFGLRDGSSCAGRGASTTYQPFPSPPLNLRVQ